jgi:hypothetical protein
MAILDEVLTDLAAEGDDLDRLLSGIGRDQWELATPAPGWTIAPPGLGRAPGQFAASARD